MKLPRDFVEEIELELDRCRRSLPPDRRRIGTLCELHASALTAAAELGHPITVFDFVTSAGDEQERIRRTALAKELRRFPSRNC